MPVAPSAHVFEAIAPQAAAAPLYRVVRRQLVHAIETGAFPQGTPLPSEAEIAAQLQVSIGTLRRAVDELVAQQLLVRRQGRGTFVAGHDPQGGEPLLSRIEREDGMIEVPSTDLLDWRCEPADDATARALRLAAGAPALCLELRTQVQGRSIAHDRLWLSQALFPGLSEQRVREHRGHLHALYQSGFGISIGRVRERSRAVGANPRHASVLAVPLGHPLLQLRSLALTPNDRPVERRVRTVRTDEHEVVSAAAAPSGHG